MSKVKKVCRNCRWATWIEPFESGTVCCAYNGMRPIKDEMKHTCDNWENDDYPEYEQGTCLSNPKKETK